MRVAQVCVVGAGISGVACARELVAAGIEVELRERAGRTGGRMASPAMDWSSLGERPVDSGAAYFTVRDDQFSAVVRDWCQRGLAREWTDTFHLLPADDGSAGLGETKTGPLRYAAPGGLRSLVADLADGLTVRTRTTVSKVRGGRPGFGRASVDGEDFDAVVLAMPDPQALRLLAEDLTEEREVLVDRDWEPVLALLATFDDRSWPDFDGGFVQEDRLSGEPVLAFVADDGRRRGDGAPVLVAHSTGSWARGRLEEPEEAAEELVQALDRVLGCGQPNGSTVHRWTYARPAEAREQECWFGGNRIGFCGDGWGSPKVETAWKSGTLLGRRVVTELT